ncbi:hypothetical protein P5673_016599 [Acropora cervicornis]|uniref:Uncharacterized protein n=1 Tax=Acropora cervicornis TaxID=6130 RepID=A0AAD9QH06_ACRCE|nr:hypothetical protein P5673_016599 [Acropora cervicornis]
MPVSAVELQRVLAILADEDQLKVSVKSAGYGGVVAGVTTTIGGLIAGPAGLLVGGALGGVLAYANAEDFKPVSQVVKEMNAHERQLLYNAMRDIVDNLAIEDYVALWAFLNGRSGVLIRQQLMDRMVQLQRVLAILADEDQLKVTVKGAGYGGVVAGVTTTIGGLIAGPAGLLVGGALGGVLAYANAGDFKPVSQVVKEMNAHERQLLYNAMRDIVDNLAIEDYVALLAFLNGGAGLLIRQQLMDRMGAFLRDQMRLQMAA